MGESRGGGYRPDIDGLRAVAILLVVGYHVGLPGFDGGFVGVDVFFVISGYLIIGLLFRELDRTGRIEWSAFFARRVRRLMPAALFMLVVLLVLSLLVMDPLGERQAFAKSAVAMVCFASNIYLWRAGDIDYFTPEAANQPLLHAWSLSVEEQFYLAVPLVTVAVLAIARTARADRRRTLRASIAVLSTVSLAAAVWGAAHDPVAAFYLPITRAYEFGIGALLALAPQRRARMRLAPLRGVIGIVGMLVLVAVTILPLPSATYPGAWAAIPALASAAIILAAGAGTGQLLERAPMLTLGRLSYGWYLWHWPLLGMVAAYNLGPAPMPVRGLTVLVALGAAALSYRWVERRFHVSPGRASEAQTVVRASPRRTLALGGLASVLVIGVALGVGLTAGVLRTTPSWETVNAERQDFPRLPSTCPTTDNDLEGPGGACWLTPHLTNRPTVVLWGDSHAFQMVPSLLAARAETNVNLVAWMRSACPPVDPSPIDVSRYPALRSCLAQNADALAGIERLSDSAEPVRVVLAARWEYYEQTPLISLLDQPTVGGTDADRAQASRVLSLGFPSLPSELAAMGVTVDLVGSSPELPRSAPVCLAVHSWRPFGCDVSRERVDAEQRRSKAMLRRVAATLPSSTRLYDVMPLLCGDRVCPARSDGIVNYFDDDHISATRARLLAPVFAPAFDFTDR